MKNTYYYPCIIFLMFSLGTCNKVKPIAITSNMSVPIIIDHKCNDISKVPKEWIQKAKAEFGISYGHTSHGSQIISGMTALKNKSKFYNFDNLAGIIGG